MPIQLVEPVNENDDFSDESRLIDLFGYLVRKLDRITDLLGGPHDNAELRSNVKKLQQKCKETANKYEEMYLSGAAAIHIVPDNIQLMKYRNLLRSFEESLRKQTTREQQRIVCQQHLLQPAKEPEAKNKQTSQSAQTLVMLTTDPEQRAELEQREKDIQQIHHSVQLINEIFNDLGIIVMQQQDLVDCVELNLENTTNRLHLANREITIATQRTQQRRYHCCGLPFGAVLFLLGLFTLLAWILFRF